MRKFTHIVSTKLFKKFGHTFQYLKFSLREPLLIELYARLKIAPQ